MVVALAARRWRTLAALTFARTAMGFQFQTIAAVSPFLGKEIGLDHAQLGWLIGLYLLPGSAFALSSKRARASPKPVRWPGSTRCWWLCRSPPAGSSSSGVNREGAYAWSPSSSGQSR